MLAPFSSALPRKKSAHNDRRLLKERVPPALAPTQYSLMTFYYLKGVMFPEKIMVSHRYLYIAESRNCLCHSLKGPILGTGLPSRAKFLGDWIRQLQIEPATKQQCNLALPLFYWLVRPMSRFFCLMLFLVPETERAKDGKRHQKTQDEQTYFKIEKFRYPAEKLRDRKNETCKRNSFCTDDLANIVPQPQKCLGQSTSELMGELSRSITSALGCKPLWRNDRYRIENFWKEARNRLFTFCWKNVT